MSAQGVKDKRTLSVLILIFVLLATGIITTGYLYYQGQAKQYRKQIEHQLAAIAELKVSEIVLWRKERLGDAAAFYKNAAFSHLVQNFFKKSVDVKARDQLQSWLRQVQAAYQYERVFLLDAQGVERMSVPDTPEPGDLYLSQNAFQILRSGQVTFRDFHRDGQGQPVHLSVLVPILAKPDSKRVIGIVVLQIDPAKYLYPFIQRWPIPSTTAETLLVRRDGNDALYLNELKFHKNTALNLRIPLKER